MKKILITSLAAILALGMIGGAFAMFQDTETSTGNTFSAGTMELEVHDGSPEEWGNACSDTWVLPEIVPGENTAGVDRVTGTVFLRRLGTVMPDHLEVQAFISLDESDNPIESDTNPASTADEMASKLEVRYLQYNTTDLLLDYLIDCDGDNVLTLNDMTYPPEQNGLDNIPIPGTLGTSFSLTLKWIEGEDDNDFQGDTLHAEVAFTLNQNASQ